MYAILHLSKPIEYTALRVNHKINHGLQVILMCPYRFISYNICITVVQDVLSRKVWGGRVIFWNYL